MLTAQPLCDQADGRGRPPDDTARPLAATIVYVTSQFPFGTAETWTLGEIRALASVGARVIVAPRTSGNAIQHAEAELRECTLCTGLLDWAAVLATSRTLVERPGLLWSGLRIAWRKSTGAADFLKGVAVLPKTFRLAEMLRGRGAVHVHGYSTTSVAVVAAVLARALGVGFSFTLHGNQIIAPPYKRMFRTLLEEASFARLVAQDGVPALAALLDDEGPRNIRAIHLGVPCEDAYDEPGPANSPFTLVTPAGLIPRKGHAYALCAARILLDRGFTSFRWQFLGRGPLQADLMAIAARDGLAGHCEFPGYVENDILLDRYRRREVDCLVLPSISLPPSEGIPHSLMQAMSFATPVIATRCGSIPELVADGAGLLVPERDAESLADAVLTLAGNDGMRRRLGARARQVVLAGFSETQTGRDLLQAFQESSRSSTANRGGRVG